MASKCNHLRPFIVTETEITDGNQMADTSSFHELSILQISHSGSHSGNLNFMLRRTILTESVEITLAKLHVLYERFGTQFQSGKLRLDTFTDPSATNRHYDKNTNPANVAALISVAKVFKSKGMMSSIDAVKLFLEKKYTFHKDIHNRMMTSSKYECTAEDFKVEKSLLAYATTGCMISYELLKKGYLLHILKSLSLNTVPLPDPKNVSKNLGHKGCILYLARDINFLSDNELVLEYQALFDFKMKELSLLQCANATSKKRKFGANSGVDEGCENDNGISLFLLCIFFHN